MLRKNANPDTPEKCPGICPASVRRCVRLANSQIQAEKQVNGHFVRLSADSPRPTPRTLSPIYLYMGVSGQVVRVPAEKRRATNSSHTAGNDGGSPPWTWQPHGWHGRVRRRVGGLTP